MRNKNYKEPVKDWLNTGLKLTGVIVIIMVMINIIWDVVR